MVLWLFFGGAAGLVAGILYLFGAMSLSGRVEALGKELGLEPGWPLTSHAVLSGERRGCKIRLYLNRASDRDSPNETIMGTLEVSLPTRGAFRAIVLEPGIRWDFPLENLFLRLPRLAEAKSYRAWGYPPVAVERFLAAGKAGRFFSGKMPARVVRLTPELVRVKFSISRKSGQPLVTERFGSLISDAVEFATTAAEAPLL